MASINQSSKKCCDCDEDKIELNSMKTKLAEYCDLVKKLKKEIDEARRTPPSENNQCCIEKANRIQRLEATLKELNLNVGKTTFEFEQNKKELEAKRDEANEKWKKETEKTSKLEIEKAKLERQNEVNIGSYQRLQEENDKLKEKQQKKNAEINELKSDNALLKAKVEVVQKERDNIKEELEQMKEMILAYICIKN